MKITELVVIGKLGRLEPDGFYSVQLSQSYKSAFNRLKEIFLIFSSHRVFFVTVEQTKSSGPRQYFRFREDGIAEERAKFAKVELAIAQEDLQEFITESPVKSLIGFNAEYKGAVIGSVSDAMINPLQSVLVIERQDGSELLVPNVDQYVKSISHKHAKVTLQNLELLLELCKSTS
jgi:ribosomal 30S subunit maturation factor RimM